MNNKPQQSNTQQIPKQPARPNEVGKVTVTGQIKIFDPQTKETYVEKSE